MKANFSLSFLAVCIAVSVANPATAGSADAVIVNTLNAPARHTTCNNSFGYPIGERAHLVVGRKHLVRIERHLVDVGLEGATVSSCNGKCDPTLKRKGNFDSGTNNFAADRKGFAEFELDIDGTAPIGHATLVLNYFGGGRGEYPLQIVRDSSITRVESTGVFDPTERVTLHGAHLDKLNNRFPGFTRVSESASAVTLAAENRVCTPRTETLELLIEATQNFCRIKQVQIPLARAPSCSNVQAGAAPAPSPAPAPAPTPAPPPRVQLPATPNLLPALATPTVLSRPLGAVVTTTRGGMVPVNTFFCSGLAANTPTTVIVPKLTWGVSGVNIEAAATRFDVQLIDVDANRVLDTLTLPQGFPANTPLVQRDNYPGRATSIRVVLNPRFQVGTAQQSFSGCFTEPGSTQTLDSKNLLLKVDPDNRINEGDRENDNELRF